MTEPLVAFIITLYTPGVAVDGTVIATAAEKSGMPLVGVMPTAHPVGAELTLR